MIEEPEIDLDHIFDRDEIAHMAASRITAVFAKEFDLAGFAVLVEVMESHRSHAALVLFARAVHVEITETNHLRSQGFGVLTQHLIEQQLGIAVDIERTFAGWLFAETIFAIAIGGGAGGVNQRDFFDLAVFEQRERVLIVVVHHVLAVVFHRVRASALMQDGADLAFVIAGE